MSQIATAMDRLRTQTQNEHLRVEGLPFFRALNAHELPVASYVGLLRALSIVYEVFEQAILHTRHSALNAVWDSSLHKLPLIDRDLAYFQPRGLPAAPVALLRAHLLTQQVRQRAHDDPVSLLGYVYVFEGSTLGGMVLQAQVARAFGITGPEGIVYLSSYGKATKAHWQAFAGRMNSVLVDPDEQDRVVAAAQEAFAGLGQIIEALYPFDTHPTGDLVRTLNPAAGSHAIPDDPRELQAALRAGERTWRKFPYYQWRYGERGQQFTRSDSAWLVTLAAHPQVVINQQISWLGRVLSSRGMPQWLLELHLRMLHEELVAAVPEDHAAYDRLQAAADMLRDTRRRYISDDVLGAFTLRFDQHADPDWSARLPETGGLLAAAVADEQAGISQAVQNIEAWMTDAERFPRQWIAAVHTTIRAAREQAVGVEGGASYPE